MAAMPVNMSADAPANMRAEGSAVMPAKLGIIGAMEVEVETLRSHMAVTKCLSRAGMDFWEGELAGLPAVVVRCGVGKVNAALCVQILADLFQVTHIVNTGVAGSLNPALDIGDIVISRDVIHHDMDVAPLGYEPGQVPGLPVLAFPGDPELIRTASLACAQELPMLNTRIGRVISGDQFISGREVKKRLTAAFGGDCTEMEGAAVAQGAYLNGIPFVILRAISDKADDSATEDYPVFEQKAAVRCARLVEALAARLDKGSF